MYVIHYIMKLLCLFIILFIITSFYSLNDGFSQREDPAISSHKIHPIISEWQSSSEPETFAKENNLSFSANKISVYIHLDKPDSISKILMEVDIQAFDDKIVVAFVTSNQIDDLVKKDFVIQITPPDYARTLPISKIEIDENVSPVQTTNYNENLIWIVIVGTILVIVIIFKKRKKSQQQ